MSANKKGLFKKSSPNDTVAGFLHIHSLFMTTVFK